MVELNSEDRAKKILECAYSTSKEISSSREKVEVLCDIAELMLEIDQEIVAQNLLR